MMNEYIVNFRDRCEAEAWRVRSYVPTGGRLNKWLSTDSTHILPMILYTTGHSVLKLELMHL